MLVVSIFDLNHAKPCLQADVAIEGSDHHVSSLQSVWTLSCLLTHCCLEIPKRVIGKQCRPRLDAAEFRI